MPSGRRTGWVLLALAGTALGGCSFSPYTASTRWEQPYDRAWDTAVEVRARDYAW